MISSCALNIRSCSSSRFVILCPFPSTVTLWSRGVPPRRTLLHLPAFSPRSRTPAPCPPHCDFLCSAYGFIRGHETWVTGPPPPTSCRSYGDFSPLSLRASHVALASFLVSALLFETPRPSDPVASDLVALTLQVTLGSSSVALWGGDLTTTPLSGYDAGPRKSGLCFPMT